MNISICRLKKTEIVIYKNKSSANFDYFEIHIAIALTDDEKSILKNGRMNNIVICNNYSYKEIKLFEQFSLDVFGSIREAKKYQFDDLKLNMCHRVSDIVETPEIVLTTCDLESAVLATEKAICGLRALKTLMDSRLEALETLAKIPMSSQTKFEI